MLNKFRTESQIITEQKNRFEKNRQDLLSRLFDLTKDKIIKFAEPSSKEYKELIKMLIVQCLLKIDENHLRVRCRKLDYELTVGYIS